MEMSNFVGRGVTGGGAGEAIPPPPFGRIEGAAGSGGVAIVSALLLAPPVLESHLRPWWVILKTFIETSNKKRLFM